MAGARQERRPVGLHGSPPGSWPPTGTLRVAKKLLTTDSGVREEKNRVRTIKGRSSLRSRVDVGTVTPTWLIRPAAKLRRVTLHITCAWVGGVLYCMASRDMGCNGSFSVAD